MIILDELDKKALEHFRGFVVKKDLVGIIKGGANVPAFVLEYLLANACSTEDEAKVQEGMESVKKISIFPFYILVYIIGFYLFKGQELLFHRIVSNLHCLWCGIPGNNTKIRLEKIFAANSYCNSYIFFHTDVPPGFSQ